MKSLIGYQVKKKYDDLSEVFDHLVLRVNILWLGLWCLMPLSTLFQLYRGFIGGGNWSIRRRTTNLSQVTYHIMFLGTHDFSGDRH